MLRRIYNSVSFRLAHAYKQRMLHRYRSAVLRRDRLSVPDRPAAEFELMTFVGGKQVDLMRYSLWSLGQSWSVLPAVRLVNDGSIGDSELKSAIAWWPKPVHVESWQSIADAHAAAGRPALRKLAVANVMARKTAAIFAGALRGPTLFADTDLLWFRGPPPMPAASVSPVIQMAQDIQPSFDAELFRHAGVPEYAQSPWLNSGLCYVAGNIYAAADLDRIMDWVSEHNSYFTDQTLLAYISKRLGCPWWTNEQILLRLTDALKPRADRSYSSTAFCRHYVGDVRHWFWRDALQLLQSRALQS